MENVLSLYIPTYNRFESLRTLLLQIESNINSLNSDLQKKIEVVVSDNCSSDLTQKTCKGFQKDNYTKRFVYTKNAKNIGADRNVLECFSKTRGKYVWLLGDDDKLHEGAIESVLELIDQHPTTGVFYLNRTVELPDGTLLKRGSPRNRMVTEEGEFSELLVLSPHFHELLRMSTLVIARPEAGIGKYSERWGVNRFISPVTLVLDVLSAKRKGYWHDVPLVRYIEGDKSSWSRHWPWIKVICLPRALADYVRRESLGSDNIRSIFRLSGDDARLAVDLVFRPGSWPPIATDWFVIISRVVLQKLFLKITIRTMLGSLLKKIGDPSRRNK